ncbi:hypothetical protein F4811DRAFT_551583 [Daldinia bambusicola]|nr:hypothetical protein F4811DRAFT_551583 [Daldinia bambusicola]
MVSSRLTTLPAIFLYATSCLAQYPDDDDDAPLPEHFPRAFIVAMAVAIVSVVLLLTVVCALAHSWQYILGGRGGPVTSSGVPERWLDPVFEWPHQLQQQLRPLSRTTNYNNSGGNNYSYHYLRSRMKKKKDKNMSKSKNKSKNNNKKNRRRLRDRIKMRMADSGWGWGWGADDKGAAVGLGRKAERADLIVGAGLP